MTNGKSASIGQLLPVIREVVGGGGDFTFCPRGRSMEPFIVEGRDAIVLSRADNVARGDILLYVRDNGKAVAHRVIGCDADGFIMCGDNQFQPEHGITQSHTVARVSAVIRDGVEISQDSIRCRVYVALLPLRRMYLRLRYTAARIKRRFI